MIPAGILGSAHVEVATGLIGSFEGLATGGSVAGNSVTFTGVAIGSAAADREVVIGVMGGDPSGSTVPTMTVNGNAATLVSNRNDTLAVFKASVPTGTTATVVVTWSAAPGVTANLAVWKVTGGIAASNASNTSSSGATVSVTVTGYTDGFIVAIAYMQTGSTPTTWTNANERSDGVMGTVNQSSADATTVGSTTIGTGNGVSRTRQLLVVALGP